MRHQVFWTPTAERELAAIWLKSPDRNRVTEAAARIEQQLRASPFTVGESRGDSFRILITEHLVVRYEASELDRKVTIFNVQPGRAR